ncbi:MAG: glutamate:GABA antiporter [Pseudonocardiales bacterium]|nr:glutamate:GABA antiporter [Pseudonocardiales bacterium]
MPASHLRRRMHPAVQRHAAKNPPGGARVLGAGSIALISLAAVLTLRGMPTVAEYGWSSIAFYVLGALFFFIPLALVAAELATGWPRAGGIYAWVKQAFGDRSGFLAVWFEWVENIVWFPTVLSFVAATLAYVIDPSLADNKLYLVIVMLAIFWALTLANFFGMRWTARLNNPGVLAGTLLPAVVLIGLGAYWLLDGRPIAIPFAADKLVPNLGSLANLVFFAGVLLGYAGIEMAGFHAKETRNPGRDYPRAIFLAAALIVAISILATLSIAFVVPQDQLSLVSGLLQAFDSFFQSLGIGTWATKVMAALTGLGTLALISTWLLGPAKGLYASEETGDLPPELHYVNERHVPVAILIAQGALGSLFALVFLFVPSINTSYWMLSALTTQILVLMYILVFAAVLRLRYTQPDAPRPYKVPGGKAGIWLVAGLGLIGSVFGLVIGFIPPTGLAHWPTPVYIAAMFGAIVLCSAPPFIIAKVKKPGWRITTPDPVLLDDASAIPASAALTNPTAPSGDPAEKLARR